MRVAIYVRISADPEGRRLGVERQREACEALARERGWAVVEVYTDNDFSAYSGRRRPAWSRMLADLRSGRVVSVLSWATDRLYRRVRDHLDLVDAVGAGGKILTVKDGEIDSSPAGQLHAGVLAQVAQFESARKGERLAAKHLELARSGRWQGGSARPFGYEFTGGKTRKGLPTGSTQPIGLRIRQNEARAIREAATALLVGSTTPTRVAVEWNRSGLTTPTGGRWTPFSVKRKLTSPHLAGIRVHRGVSYKAQWKPILTEDERMLLRARLLTEQKTEGVKGRRYPLTGLVECGECGAPMIGSGGAYRCQPRRGGCNRVRIDAARLDAEVFSIPTRIEHEQRMERLKDPQKKAQSPQESPGPSQEALKRLRALQERRETLVADIAEGRLSRNTGYEAVARVETAIADTEAQLARELPPPKVSFRDRPDVRRLGRLNPLGPMDDKVPEFSPEETQAHREWVGQYISKVVVRPQKHGGRFPADTVEARKRILARITMFDAEGKEIVPPEPEPETGDEDWPLDEE